MISSISRTRGGYLTVRVECVCAIVESVIFSVKIDGAWRPGMERSCLMMCEIGC